MSEKNEDTGKSNDSDSNTDGSQREVVTIDTNTNIDKSEK